MIARAITRLRGSFWLIPTMMTLASIALAMLMWRVDASSWGQAIKLWPGGAVLGAEGARLVVATIAGAMITAASLVYSMTLVALSLASSSAGPRTLGELMRQRAMQVSLGLFLATFVYALLVLRTIYGTDGAQVPNLSVTVAIGLAIVAFCWLIYFIHELSHSMQTDTIVARAAAGLVKSIEAAAPRASEPIRVQGEQSDALAVQAQCRGYIDIIDTQAVASAAKNANALVRLRTRPGHFIIPTTEIAYVYGAAAAQHPALEKAIRDAVIVGDRRTATQDLEYRVHLLVEIAARALSSGMNDFYTAISCVDHLAGALSIAVAQGLHAPEVLDESGRVRVVRYPLQPSDLIDAAFNPIRQCAADSVPVALRVLEALTQIVSCANDRITAETIGAHAHDMAHAALLNMKIESDKQALRDRMAAFTTARHTRFRAHTFSDLML